MGFTLKVLAIHRLDVAPAPVAVPIGVAERPALSQRAAERIEGYVTDLQAREEALGKAVPAWWESTQPPQQLARLMTCPVTDFEAASLDGMNRLVAATPGTASTGVIVFVRGSREDGADTLAIFKMAPHDVTHTQFHPDTQAAQAITVEEITNVLPEPNELAKAAITPHPLDEAPLRVVDTTRGGEPAGYWLKFLGAQQPPKQPKVGQMLVEVSETALAAAGLDPDAVRGIVANQLEAVVAAGQPVEPRTFLDGIARAANQPLDQVWGQAQELHAELALPHARVSPVATEQLKTTIDLNDGIMLVGPATVMKPPRVEIGQDGNGWYVKIATSAPPRPRTR